MFRAFRQALAWAYARGLIEREPTAGIKNPKRKRAERRDVHPFEDWTECDLAAGAARFGPKPESDPSRAADLDLRNYKTGVMHPT